MMPKRKKTSPLKFMALLLIFTASFFIGRFIADLGFGGQSNTASAGSSPDKAELPVNRLNVLLLGIDAREGEKDARTDSIILVSIDRETKKIAMVSIPRDTLVDIPGHGPSKINAANVFGGADLARQMVEGLLGVEIPYYVKTNFEGFKEIVDTLGGVNIDVEKRMYYPAENINLYPGPQRLDGYNALGYVRFRHDALGDIGRTQRQQKFLSALAKEMLRARTIIKAPVLIPQLMKAVDTNLGVSDAIFLARVASGLDSANIATATLPGTFYNYKGASYWKADEEKAKLVLHDLFEGLKVATITGPDINVPPDKPAGKEKQAPVAKSQETAAEPGAEASPGPADQDGIPGTGLSGSGTENPAAGNGSSDGNSDPGNGSANTGNATPENGLPPDAVTGQPGQTPGSQTGGGGQPPAANNQSSSPAGGASTGPVTPDQTRPGSTGTATGITGSSTAILSQG